MKSFVSDLLIKFNLRFKSPATEQDYHRHIKPFADVNFQFFLVFLLLLQLGMLAFEILTKELVLAILIGLCLISNTLLLIFRKKYHFIFEKAAIIFVTTIYVISALHFRKRQYDGPSEFTRDQAFFETYGICLFHQIALKYLTGFLKVLIIDICAIIFRCILFYQSAWAFPFSFSIQILVDLAILYACYKKEVNSRTIYNQLLNQKEGTSKFKSLMVNSLPENIIIMDNTLTRELFANNAFQKIFRSLSGTSETRKDSRNDLLHRTYILKESLETVEALPSLVNKYLKENPTVTLWDFLQQGNRSRLFKEEVFIVYGTLTPPTAHKSGLKRRIFEIKIFSFRWDEEEAIVIILNEVTHRETILGLRLSDMSKDKVISSVSHELRTPLNGIQGMIQIMQKQADDPQLLTSLAICKSSADLLLHIINSIIDLQFLTKNKLVLHKSKVSVRELISQIGNLFIFQCEHKRLDLTLSIDEGAPEYIITDKERLMQVLVHLASNAVKFTFKGGITIGARVDPRTPESILFCVSDTGTGIKDNNKAALFKMFGHLENMNSVGTQGIGLGLTISKELVMRLKATKADNVIEMNSEFGKGSTFSFSLPFDLTQAEMEGADKEDFGEVGQEYDASDHRGLIIKSRRSSNRRFDDREEGSDSKFLSQLLMRKLGSDQEDDFEDIGEELGLDQRNISDFLYFGPIQEKLTHYVTRPPRYNTYKLIEGSSSSGKITFEESPTLKSLIKISSPGLQYEFHPKSQTDVPKEERREVRESPPMEEKGENFSDISSVPFKVNDSNRRKGVETFTNNLDNSQFLAREIQSATSIVSTPRERKKSRMTSRHFGRMQTKQYTSKSILVVDDNSFNLLVAQHIIEDSGFQVITAVSGQNGINEVKKRSKEGIEPFKLILMDLQMPVMDGFETTSILIKMMKANEIPEIPIVALTANTTEEDIAKCLQHGMVNHLGKPLNKEALVRVFNSLEES